MNNALKFASGNPGSSIIQFPLSLKHERTEIVSDLAAIEHATICNFNLTYPKTIYHTPEASFINLAYDYVLCIERDLPDGAPAINP